VDAKQERWDDIRHLTEDQDEWEKIKNELVVYAMKRDANTPAEVEISMKSQRKFDLRTIGTHRIIAKG
jgi:hypothetical protein